MGYFDKLSLSAWADEQNPRITVPNKIQCGLAGGNWDHYFSMISNFQDNNQHVKIRICKF
jgi:hypothetical protein